jgi:glucose-6-phosphate isomerase
MISITDPQKLLSRFDPTTGTVAGAPLSKRYLSDLRGCFNDAIAFEHALSEGNPLVYTVAAVAPADGDGDLHFGLGTLYPGSVGDEYFLTKGHIHTWRDAAEVYIGIAGRGAMLLEDEATGESQMVTLHPNSVVYVPARTGHRTMNTGDQPLVYLGVYPAKAGHDYGAFAERNFRCVVLKRDGRACMLKRSSI